MPIGITTGYKNSAGVDIGEALVPKSYLMDRYPELANTFRFAGLWLWGRNDYGQLGTNDVSVYSTPTQTIAGGANWKQLISGVSRHAAGIKTDGTLWLWGKNNFGQLGTNDDDSPSSEPVQTVAGGTNWKQVAGGSLHTAAIKTDGTLWTWGSNAQGQLGDNTITAKLSPVQTVAAGTNWKQVSCGYVFTAAIKTDGTLWTWGGGSDGQLGTNASANRSSPVQTVAAGTNWRNVTCGQDMTTAIKTDGTLWTWGRNDFGQLGDNTVIRKSSPVQTVAGGTNWKSLASTIAQTPAAIKTDGTLWVWGRNNLGSLANGTPYTSTSSPVQTVAGGTNWKQVTLTSDSGLAIKTDGTLWAWGDNSYYGILGTGDSIVYPTYTLSAVQVLTGGSTNWLSISSNMDSVFAIKDNSNDYI